MKNLNIRIMNENETTGELLKKRNFWNVISIRSPDSERIGPDAVKDLAVDFLPLVFHDVWHKSQIKGNIQPPTRTHVNQAMEWAKGKVDILVHCKSGVSRSSSLAYVLACCRMTPEEALKVLNFKIHYPNQLIVMYGAELLENAAVWDVFFGELSRQPKVGIDEVF